MNTATTTIKSALLGLACLWLPDCAGGRSPGEHIADMPHWMGGLPADAPPRRGSQPLGSTDYLYFGFLKFLPKNSIATDVPMSKAVSKASYRRQ